MKSIQTNTASLLNGKKIKSGILPSCFYKYELSKCYALTKSITFNPHNTTNLDAFLAYELVGKANTGLLIAQGREDGKIYLYGEVDKKHLRKHAEESNFLIVSIDWFGKNKKMNFLLLVAENINLFVDECLE
jgi:hypothetical protein